MKRILIKLYITKGYTILLNTLKLYKSGCFKINIQQIDYLELQILENLSPKVTHCSNFTMILWTILKGTTYVYY